MKSFAIFQVHLNIFEIKVKVLSYSELVLDMVFLCCREAGVYITACPHRGVAHTQNMHARLLMFSYCFSRDKIRVSWCYV